MARSLADLKTECKKLGLAVVHSGKREAKADYESVLRSFYWKRDYGDVPILDQYDPMLARNVKDLTEAEAAPMWQDDSNWVVQEKLDGVRAILQINPLNNPLKNGAPLRNEVTSRRVSDETYRLNELTEKLVFYRDFPFPAEWHGAVVDGELIMPVAEVNTGDTVTKTVLQATAATLNCDPAKALDIQTRHGVMRFQVFDLLKGRGGKDIRHLTYAERYAELSVLVHEFAEVCVARGWSVP